MLRFFDKSEEITLCLLLATMIFIACLQIVLRTFFSSGLLWADALLRYLVLWCGLIGAVTATGQGKHIALDIFGKRIPTALKPWLTLLTYLFCVATGSGLTWAACRFLAGEIEFGGAGPLSLPLWFWNAIFPLAFGLITLKYFILLVFHIRSFFTTIPAEN